MSDVAAIGIKIETDSIEKGIKSLDVLAQQGPKVESSMKGVESSTARAAKSLADLGSKNADGLKSVGDAGKRAADGLKAMGDASKGAATDAASVSRAMADMTKQEEAYVRSLLDQVQALRLSKSEFAAYKAQMMGYSQGTQDIARALGAQADSMKSYASASDVALGSMTRLVSGGIQAFVGSRLVTYTLEAAKAMYDASAQAQRLQTTLNYATGGNGAREIDMIRQSANNLGLAFNDTAKAYAQFQAAARGTSLEGTRAREVFESIAKASAVLGLSASDTGGVLLALQQMISKGTVQSEELRGQLGERLPGAFQSAARAMGVTTAELGKMLEQGKVVADEFLPKFAAQIEKDFGGAAEKAADRLDAAVNRWENAWQRLKQAGGDSGVSTVMADQYNSYASGIDAMAASMERARKEGSGFLGQMGAAIDTAYKLGDRTQQVTVNMYENAKATASAEKQLAELQKRAEVEGRGLFYQYQFDNLTKLIARLKEAKTAFDNLQAKSVAPDAAQMFNADELEVANSWQKQVERTTQIEAKLTEARMRAAGINKKYLEDLSSYKDALDNGSMSLVAYKAAVVDLIKDQWESSKAGKAEAEAKREAEAASKKAEAAVRKEGTTYANLLTQINQVIAKNKEEIDGRKHLSESQKLEIALTEALKAGKKNITAVHEAELRARIAIAREQDRLILQTKREVETYQSQVAAQDEVNKAYARQYDEVTKVRLAIDELRKSTNQDTERLRLEASLIGATNERRQVAIQLYDLEIEKRKELDRIGNTDYTGTPAEARKARAEAEAEVERIYAQRAANIAGKAYLDEWQKTVDQVENWFTDSFTRMLTDGKDGWDSFCKSLKNSFTTLVVKEIYAAFAKPFVVNIVGSLVGMTGSGTAQAAGQIASGGSGILGTASNLSSMWNAFSGGMTATLGGAVSSLGSAFGSAALSSFGAGMQGATLAAGLAGPTTAGAGGAMGLGASFGTALPYIGAGLAVISLLGSGMFSTRGANHGGIAYSTSGASTADTARLLTSGLGWKDPEQDFTVRGSTDKQAIKEFKDTIDGVKEMYKELGKIARGSVRDIDVAAGFATNSKYNDEESYGYFKIIDKVTGQILQSYTNRDMSKDGQEAWKQYVADLGKGMLDQLKSADIPSWMDKILGDLGDTPTFEGLQAAVASIVAIDTAFKGWSANIVGFVNTSDQFRQALLDNSGGLNGLASNMEAFYSGFYSEEERYLNARAGVMKQLASLGLEIDPAAGAAAKEQFRAAVEGAMSSGNAELVAQLLAVSGAFAQVADAAGQTRETFADVFESWSNSIAGFAGTSDAFRQALLSSAGSMDTLQSNMEAFYNGFYSEEERFMNARAEMQKKLSALGLEIDPGAGDAAKEQFRAAVESAMAAGNSALVAQLLSLAGSFAQVADAARQAGGTVNQTAEQMREAALQASGLSVSGLVNGFLGEINAGRGEQAGAWLADAIADGFEQAVYGQALSIVMSAIVDGVITPVVTAALAGTSISEAISEAAIDTMVAKATAAADALNALLSNDAFRGAMDSILGTVRDLGNSIGASITPQYSARRAQEEARRAEAERAATQAAQERYNLESRLLQLQGDTATLRARELAQLDPANRALQEQIYALEDAQAAQDAYADSLSKAQSAYESAMSRVQSAQSTVDSIRAQGTQNYIDAQKAVQAAQERIVQIQLDAANEIAKTFLDLGKSLRDWLTTQRSSDTNPQAAFQQMLTKALAGDADAMRGLTAAAQAADEYAKANAASQVQYELERARIQAGVSKAAGVAETKGLGYQAPNPLADAQAALVAANAALAQALSVANAINAPLQQPSDSLITQYTKALQELNNANSSLAQQQAALDSIKTGVWDTSTKTGQVNSSVGAGTIATSNGLGGVQNATGQVKGSTDLVKSSVDALAMILNAIKDQTWWLTGIFEQSQATATRMYSVMNSTNYQNGAFTSDGYVRVQSQNRGGTAMWFAKGGIVDSMTPFAFGAGQLGIMGEAGPEAIMPTQRMSNGDLGVRVQMPRMDWSSYGRDPALVAEIRELRAENRAQAAAMVGMQRELVRLHERWDRNGLPETREIDE